MCSVWNQAVQTEQSEHHAAYDGFKVSLDQHTHLSVLWPAESVQGQTLKNDNNASIVMILDHKGQKVLLTGDIEAAVERQLAKRKDIDIDFLKETSPRAAFIQAGADNSYGHPHVSVTQLLASLSIPYYSTHRDGRIELVLNSQGYKIQTEK